jgi:protein-S-isoprenylcysteine O-methyltransferase Ste14
VLLAGYSLGADVLPFMASRLPADLLDRVEVIALLGPSRTTPLEIRVKENKAAELPVRPEVQKLRGRRVLCVAAAGEEDSLCSDLGPDLAERLELQGTHAFDGDYEQLADRILGAAQHRSATGPAGPADPAASHSQTGGAGLRDSAGMSSALAAGRPALAAMPAAGLPAGARLYAFHALFYAVFAPRWLLRWWHALENRSSHRHEMPAIAAGAGNDAAAVQGRQPTAGVRARGSSMPLILHALAEGVLYVGIARVVLVPPAVADPFLLPPQRVAGACFMLAAVALATWTLAVFRSWRLAARIEHGHELCTAGPFRWVRHPIYLAMDLLALGTWLWVPTSAVGLGVVLVALAGDLRARTEERLLHDTFGQAYDSYLRNVRRFVPGIY